MTVVLAIVPDPWVDGSRLTATGTEDGVTSDVSMEVRSPTGLTFTMRTLLRLGERINSAGVPHGTMTDDISVATLAACSQILPATPPGLQRREPHTRIQTADEDASAVARDRASWVFAPLVLAHVTYALWHRPLAGGFVAHADFGDRVLAAWGNGDLPPELLRAQLVDVSSYHFG